jgi:hypothetical protein
MATQWTSQLIAFSGRTVISFNDAKYLVIKVIKPAMSKRTALPLRMMKVKLKLQIWWQPWSVKSLISLMPRQANSSI